MSYKRKHFDEDRKTYEATVLDDGSIRADDQRFTSPSYAALYFINRAGSPRQTVNGWTSWRTESGRLLADLREQLLRTARCEPLRLATLRLQSVRRYVQHEIGLRCRREMQEVRIRHSFKLTLIARTAGAISDFRMLSPRRKQTNAMR